MKIPTPTNLNSQHPINLLTKIYPAGTLNKHTHTNSSRTAASGSKLIIPSLPRNHVIFKAWLYLPWRSAPDISFPKDFQSSLLLRKCSTYHHILAWKIINLLMQYWSLPLPNNWTNMNFTIKKLLVCVSNLKPLLLQFFTHSSPQIPT